MPAQKRTPYSAISSFLVGPWRRQIIGNSNGWPARRAVQLEATAKGSDRSAGVVPPNDTLRPRQTQVTSPRNKFSRSPVPAIWHFHRLYSSPPPALTTLRRFRNGLQNNALKGPLMPCAKATTKVLPPQTRFTHKFRV